MRSKPGPPMTLSNMRADGVHAVTATCEACGHKADVNVDALPESVTLPEAGRRLRCSSCGGKTISTRPAWHTGSQRPGVPDYRREQIDQSGAIIPPVLALPSPVRSLDCPVNGRGQRQRAKDDGDDGDHARLRIGEGPTPDRATIAATESAAVTGVTIPTRRRCRTGRP